MTELRARKVRTCKTNDTWWLLFPQGHIDKPLCVISEHEMEVLLRDIKTEEDNDGMSKV